MSLKYKNLLSPIKVRNHVLKNRMESANSLPHFLQGPENYPADPVITHYVNRAKNGAAIVTCMGINNLNRNMGLPMEEDVPHFPDFDIYDPMAQNYLVQLADELHYYNTIAAMAIFVAPQSGYLLQTANGFRRINSFLKHNELTEQELEDIADSFAQQSLILKKLGFDMVSLHFAYRLQLPGQLLSPITNFRTDKFGGSLENRMRFPLMVLRKVREVVRNEFLIEILISAEDPVRENRMTIEETVEFLKQADKYVDIVQVRGPEIDPAHPTGFTLERTPFLKYAEYIKKNGVKALVSTIGGYQNLDDCETAIRERKADIIGMARSWISNSNFGELAYTGNNEDIIPCLRCNKCHGSGNTPVISACSVNPLVGIEHHVKLLEKEAGTSKNIAIIGGGPAGMKVAMDLHDRGHKVTIYEASNELGGQIKHSDYVDFKWPLRDFKNYLIRQVQKRNVTIHYDVEVTRKTIENLGYDIIIAAIGAKAFIPQIQGISRSKNIVIAEKAFENHEKLGNLVVIIGGGEVGVECGMYLAKKGHEVTVLEMKEELAADSAKIHYRSMFEKAWKATKHFSFQVNAKCIGINENEVIYLKEGIENNIKADSIVIASGMLPKQEEAMSFYNIADGFYMIGDCRVTGTVQYAMRSAYAVASTL